MNYLAHAYLSFQFPEILAGNMISDFIKGKAKFDYPEGIQQGIMVHRAIDDFTDFHPVTQQAKQCFRAQYRLYSGPFVDIVYDHFLANDRKQFASDQELHEFSLKTYLSLRAQEDVLPSNFRRLLPYMESQNWLFNYRKQEGIRNSFNGLVRRAKYLDESDIAYQLFLENYEDLRRCYEDFFPELKLFVMKQLSLN